MPLFTAMVTAPTDEAIIKASPARLVRWSALGGALILTSRSLRFESSQFDAGFPMRGFWRWDLDVALAEITNVAAKRGGLSIVAPLLLNVWLLLPAFRRIFQSNLEVRTASAVHRFAVPRPDEWLQALRPR